MGILVNLWTGLEWLTFLYSVLPPETWFISSSARRWPRGFAQSCRLILVRIFWRGDLFDLLRAHLTHVFSTAWLISAGPSWCSASRSGVILCKAPGHPPAEPSVPYSLIADLYVSLTTADFLRAVGHPVISVLPLPGGVQHPVGAQ